MTVSLTRRLVLTAAVWSCAGLIAAGFVLATLNARLVLSRFEQDLAEYTQNLATVTEGHAGRVVVPPMSDPRFARVYSGRYWQISSRASGEPLARSRSLWDQSLAVPHKMVSVGPQFFDQPGPDHQMLRTAALGVKLPAVAAPMVFMVAYDRRPIDRDIRQFTVTLGQALAVLGIGLLVGLVLQVRFAMSPVYGMGREVAAVRDGRLRRLAGQYPTELAPLADELNALIGHSEDVVERARAQVGDLAHALKTPLAVLSVDAQQVEGVLAEQVRRQVAAMSSQVDRYLRRARAAARSRAAGASVALDVVLQDLIAVFQKIHADRKLQFDVAGVPRVHVRVERQDLEDMLGNLIENACKWTAGRICVSATAHDGMVHINIHDDGPGLDELQWQAALKRGMRLDETVPGTGLGLSIVDELARAYGGQLTRCPSETGLCVILSLPRTVEIEP